MHALNLKIFFIIGIFFSLLMACEKDEVYIQPNEEIIKETTKGGPLKDNSFESLSLDGVPAKLINPEDQYFLTAFVDFLDRLYGDIHALGTPVTNAIVSEEIDGDLLGWIPLVNDPATEEIDYLLLYNETTNGDYSYYIFERPDAEINAPVLGEIPNLTNSSRCYGIIEEDIAYLFSRYEEELFNKTLPPKYQDSSIDDAEGRWWWPFNRDRTRCYNFSGGGSFFSDIWDAITDLGGSIRGLFQGSGSGTTGGGDPDDFTGVGFYYVGGTGSWTNGGQGHGSVNPNTENWGGSTLHPPYHVDMLMLQDCEGYSEPHDTEDTPDGEHPNYDFCSEWMDYRSDCLSGFDSYDEMIELMAMLYYYQPTTFEYVLTYDNSCNAQQLLELIFSKHYDVAQDGPIRGYHFEESTISNLLYTPALVEALMELESRNAPFGVSEIDEIIPLLAAFRHISVEVIEQVIAFYDRHDDNYYNNNNSETIELLQLEDLVQIKAILEVDEELGLDEDEVGLMIREADKIPAIDFDDFIEEVRNVNEILSTNLEKTDFLKTFEDINQNCDKFFFNFYGSGGVTEQMMVDGKCVWVHSYWNSQWNADVSYAYNEDTEEWALFDRNTADSGDPHMIDVLIGAMIETGHTTLDILGLVPVAGELADGINMIWYYTEGDYVNAGLSSLSMLPFIGTYTGVAQITRNSLKVVRQGADEFFESANGLLYKIGDNTSGNTDRLGHVFEHVENVTTYPSGAPKNYHGVFEDTQNVVGVVDNAWAKVQSGSADVISDVGGGATDRVVIVEMHTRVGWQGGAQGAGEVYDLTKVKIVIKKETSNEVITAFPQ